MDLDLVFVGTAASLPSPARGLSSALLRRGGERILLDCGEGTQRQLMRSAGLAELDAVLLTHLHADHVLGLPGMLKTFNLRERDHPLVLAGPPGLERFVRQVQPLVGRIGYELEVREVAEGTGWTGEGYRMEAVPTDHSTRSVAWRLVEEDRPGRLDVAAARELGVAEGPDLGVLQRGGTVTAADGSTVTSDQVVGEARTGRTVVYSGDTRPCESVRDAARDATLLVHEATFLEADAERARQTRHSTAREAAIVAAAADVSMLALTHLSTRYPPRELLAEAREVVEDVVLARDFDVIELPYPERGEPRLLERAARRGRGSGGRATPQAERSAAGA